MHLRRWKLVFKEFKEILNDLFGYVGEKKVITDFNVGSAVRTILEGVAAIAEELWFSLRFYTYKFFISTSSGEWLDRRLGDFGMIRKQGSAAFGELIIGRDTPTQIGILIPSGTIFQNDTGEIRYSTKSDVRINIGETTVIVQVEAIDVGTAYNLAAGTILKQSGIAITGIEWAKIKLMGGGEDIEDDESFKAKVPDYFDSLGRGIENAIKYAALNVTGVKSVTLKENHPSKGWFTIYIDDGSGTANQTLLQTVRAVLEDYRAFTILYIVDTAKLKELTVTLTLVFTADVQDKDSVKASVQKAIVDYVGTLKMGQGLYLADLIYLARGVAGVENVRIANPVADVEATEDELLRTSLEKVIIS